MDFVNELSNVFGPATVDRTSFVMIEMFAKEENVGNIQTVVEALKDVQIMAVAYLPKHVKKMKVSFIQCVILEQQVLRNMSYTDFQTKTLPLTYPSNRV